LLAFSGVQGARIRTVVVGLGPIGLAAARFALERPSLDLVAAVDLDPARQGRDLGELLDWPPAGLLVEPDAEAALARHQPDVAILCTASQLPPMMPLLLACARAGVDVVSSCEELLLPDLRHPDLAAELDAAARAGGATILGTGVNPGFVLDFLPVAASGVCREVRSVRARRVVDAATRRLPLQRKVGAGITGEEFAARAAAGTIGHVGIRESAALVARALGWGPEAVEEDLEPVIADRRMETEHLVVEAGRVAGIRNRARALASDLVVVELDLAMYVGAPDPGDEIDLDADPPVSLRLQGGVPGDRATAAILVNSVRQVAAAPPGVTTVVDLPPPRPMR
jgi:4-hydroxy-tetrahydrodipicolinate reductase